jgi:hypothetical protein
MSTPPKRRRSHAAHPEFAKAEGLFWRDLPKLLPEKRGRWVVYTSNGYVLEGTDGIELEKKCRRLGLKRGHYLVARVEPDAPVADVPLEWCLLTDE